MDAGAGATEQTAHEGGGPVFAAAVAFLINSLEGGSRVIRDQGGLTKWGISQNAYPHLDIANLTREQAEAIYFADFWRPVRGNALPPALALVVFDMAVNSSPGQAVRTLQRVLRVEVDGVMGPITVAAAKTFVPVRELVAQFMDARWTFYHAIAAADPARHGSSLHGWRMRLWRLAQEAGRDVWRSLSSTRELSR